MNSTEEDALIIGIDCATQLKNVGIAVAHLSGGTFEIQQVFLDDIASSTELAEKLATKHILQGDRILVALDAPLGWPDAMRTELAAHAAGRPLATSRQRMFSRLTDRFVKRRTGKMPLSGRI